MVTSLKEQKCGIYSSDLPLKNFEEGQSFDKLYQKEE